MTTDLTLSQYTVQARAAIKPGLNTYFAPAHMGKVCEKAAGKAAQGNQGLLMQLGA